MNWVVKLKMPRCFSSFRGGAGAFRRRSDLVYTTTRPARKSTHLLPFDNGDGFGAGGPENPNGNKKPYLSEQVWQRDSLLEILTRFIHLKAINRTMVVIYGHLHRASRQRNPGLAVKQNLISSSSRCW